MRLRRLFGREDDTDPREGDADATPDDAAPDEDVASVEVTEAGGEAEETEAEATEGPAEAATVTVAAGDGHDEGAEADGEDEDETEAEDEADGSGGAEGDTEAPAEEEATGPFQQVQFELADWGSQERKLLDEILNGVRVRRVWEAGTLVVAARDADVVDDLIDEIEERAALNLAPDVEPVVYDVRDWPDGLEDRFVEALIEGRIAHMRGYQEITIGVDDEERVDTLVEEVTSAWEDEQPEEGEEEEPDAQEVLSELFVTSDRLLHDASDKAATVRFDDAADAVGSMRLPFGFAEGDWSAIKDAVVALRERLGDADAQDDDIEESATTLRSLLRPLV